MSLPAMQQKQKKTGEGRGRKGWTQLYHKATNECGYAILKREWSLPLSGQTFAVKQTWFLELYSSDYDYCRADRP